MNQLHIHIVAVVVQSLSHVQLFATPWTAVRQASLSLSISQSLPKLMFIASHPLMPCSSALNLSQHQRLPISRLYASDDQNTGAFASASVLPVNIQSWSPLRFTGLILLSTGFSGVFSSTRVWRHHSSLAFCLLYGPALTTKCDHWEDHSLDYMDLCWQSNVSAFQRSL